MDDLRIGKNLSDWLICKFVDRLVFFNIVSDTWPTYNSSLTRCPIALMRLTAPIPTDLVAHGKTFGSESAMQRGLHLGDGALNSILKKSMTPWLAWSKPIDIWFEQKKETKIKHTRM